MLKKRQVQKQALLQITSENSDELSTVFSWVIGTTPSHSNVRLTLRLRELTVSTKAKGCFTPSKNMVKTTFQLL